MVRLILFDIDGTLIRTGGAGEKAFARVCEEEFQVPDGTRHLHFAGRTDGSIVRDFFERHAIAATPENFQRFFAAYLNWLPRLLQQLNGQVLPGVPELLADLQRLPHPPVIGLLTGNIRPGARLKLGHYGLWDHFELGAFGDDHEDRNHLAVVARARGAERLQRELAGDEILVIGDTPRDVECARAIAARVLAVATGNYSLADLRACQPTWAVTDLRETLVKELCG